MTEEEIGDYINAVVEHAVNNVTYSNYFVSQIRRLAEQALEDCLTVLLSAKRSNTKKQKGEIDNEIARILLNFEKEVDEFVAKEMAKIIESESEFLNSIIGSALGVSFVIPATALSILSIVPIANAGIPKNFGNYCSDGLKKIYDSMTNQSYVFGEDYEELADQYESRFNAYIRGLEAEAETVGYSLPNEFDRIVYTKNDKKISSYIWNSMLDTSTCLLCASLSGTRYEKIEDVPYYPPHLKCRCFICPCTDEIADNIPESYSEWFEKQPREKKYEALGKTRFQLYEKGMKIKQFVNNGKITPLKDLRK